MKSLLLATICLINYLAKTTRQGCLRTRFQEDYIKHSKGKETCGFFFQVHDKQVSADMFSNTLANAYPSVFTTRKPVAFCSQLLGEQGLANTFSDNIQRHPSRKFLFFKIVFGYFKEIFPEATQFVRIALIAEYQSLRERNRIFRICGLLMPFGKSLLSYTVKALLSPRAGGGGII